MELPDRHYIIRGKSTSYSSKNVTFAGCAGLPPDESRYKTGPNWPEQQTNAGLGTEMAESAPGKMAVGKKRRMGAKELIIERKIYNRDEEFC